MLNPIVGEIFCIDKPLEMTSFSAVKQIRGRFRKHLSRKNIHVGHAGTLDPLATGVLIVCTGRLTKRIEELQAGVKEYIAWIRLGETTPSYDMVTKGFKKILYDNPNAQMMVGTIAITIAGNILS